MPNTPAYYPRTKKPRKKTKDERFIKRSGELREQNKRIRGAKTARELLRDKEAGVVSPTQKKPLYLGDEEGRLPASRAAEAQITPELTPSRVRRLKQIDDAKTVRDQNDFDRPEEEAVRKTKIELGDREKFHVERKAGEHKYPNTLDGVRRWKHDKLAEQRDKDSYKKRTGDKQTMERVKDLQDRIGRLDPGKQADAWKNVRESGLFDDVIDIAQPAGDIDSIIGKPQTEAEIADAKFKRKLAENEAVYKQAETLNAASKKKTRKQRTADARKWFESPFSVRIGVEIPEGMDEKQMLAGMSEPERDAYARGKTLDKLVQNNKIDPHLAMKEFEKVQNVLAAAKIKSVERAQDVADAKAKQIEFDKREVAKAAKAVADQKRKEVEAEAERKRTAALLEAKQAREERIADQEREEKKQDKIIDRKVKLNDKKIARIEKQIDQHTVDLSSEKIPERLAAGKAIADLRKKQDAIEAETDALYADNKPAVDAAVVKTPEGTGVAVKKEPVAEPVPQTRQEIIDSTGYTITDMASWGEGTVIDATKMAYLMAFHWNNEEEVQALFNAKGWK